MSHDVFLAAIHHDDRERIDLAVKDALANKTAYDVEMRVPWSDGSLRWVALKGEASYDAAGRPVRMAGMAMDITERQRAQNRIRALYETGLIGVFYWTVEGSVTDANDKFLEITGYTREDLRSGRIDWAELTPPEWRHLNEEALRNLKATGANPPFEKEYIRKDGSRVPIILGAVMLDEIRHEGVAFVVDISEQKRAEASLREADRRKDEFLGVLSHELRNPLAPIRNAVHILDSVDPTSPQAAQARSIVSRQVDHLARLVDDLLDVKRISTGKLRLQRTVMDLTGGVRETVEDLRAQFVSRSVALDLELPEHPVWVDGDRTRLAQVLDNLLQNASKFTNPGGHVLVSLQSGSGQAHVRVRDDGVGIPPELVGSLFNPFIQNDKTLHRSMGGLGLGLSLVRGIALLHGGTVVAHSEGEGKGAEFVVSLPTTEHPAATEKEPAVPHPVAKHRVLIIEDNIDAAESLRDVVEVLGGHQAEIAHDGVSGLEAARQNHPDVVLCDLGLPTMDGYEVARRLRASGVGSEARLVALSGYASPEDVERATRAGFDSHIAKPPDIDRLLTLVAEAPTFEAKDSSTAAG
jgi:PAS domain S-box-containing protein